MEPKERGFTLVELLVVVGIIGIILAISVPYIMNYLQVYRLRTAAQEVVGELQSARIQAVMKNTNRGVALFVADANTYRYVNFDLLGSADPVVQAQATGPLRHLPPQVVFDAGALPGTATNGVRFSRLGASCWFGADATCPATLPVCPEPQCNDNASTATWVRGDGATGTASIMLRDERNGLTSTVEILLNGRVQN